MLQEQHPSHVTDIEDMIAELSEQYLRDLLAGVEEINDVMEHTIKDIQMLNEYFQTALTTPGVNDTTPNTGIASTKWTTNSLTGFVLLVLIVSSIFWCYKRKNHQRQCDKTK